LKPRDIKMLKYILDSRDNRGLSPTYREIKEEFKLASTEQVIRVANRLKLKGFLEIDPNLEGLARNLIPTDRATEAIEQWLDELNYDEGASI